MLSGRGMVTKLNLALWWLNTVSAGIPPPPEWLGRVCDVWTTSSTDTNPHSVLENVTSNVWIKCLIYWPNLGCVQIKLGCCHHNCAPPLMQTHWASIASVPDHASCHPSGVSPSLGKKSDLIREKLPLQASPETRSKLLYSGFQSWLSPEKPENQDNQARPPEKKERGKRPQNPPSPIPITGPHSC